MFTVAIIACSIGGTPATLPPATNDGGVPNSATNIIATSAIPTSTLAASGNALPSGALILNQQGNAIARLVTGRSISLNEARYGAQASNNGRYGVRYAQAAQGLDLFVVDYSTPDTNGKSIPQGNGLGSPTITWKTDGSGFAFYDFPAPNTPIKPTRTIYYYDVASGQTKVLINPPADSTQTIASISFSPDGKYLLYAQGATTSEGIGGSDSKLFLFDTATNAASPLVSGIVGVDGWADNQRFIVHQREGESVKLFLYTVTNLASGTKITPNGFTDYLVSIAPQGDFVALTSAADVAPNTASQPAQIYTMKIDGSSRKALTTFSNIDDTITGLVWGNDGIYYSINNAENKATTWRMDLDGRNVAKIEDGNLIEIVGLR